MWAESTTHGLTFYITIFTGLIIGGLVLLYGLCLYVVFPQFRVPSDKVTNLNEILLRDSSHVKFTEPVPQAARNFYEVRFQ